MRAPESMQLGAAAMFFQTPVVCLNDLNDGWEGNLPQQFMPIHGVFVVLHLFF